MMKLRLALIFGLLAVLCLTSSTRAEEPKSEPEPEAEAEPGHSHDEDSKHAGSSVSGKTKSAQLGGQNPASAPWAFSAPAILALVCVAKFIL